MLKNNFMEQSPCQSNIRSSSHSSLAWYDIRMIITVFTLTATVSPYFTIPAAAGLPIILRRSDVCLSTLKIILRLVEVVAEIQTSRYWRPNMSHSGSRETNKTKPLLMWRSKSHKNSWGCCASSLVPSKRQRSLYVCVLLGRRAL